MQQGVQFGVGLYFCEYAKTGVGVRQEIPKNDTLFLLPRLQETALDARCVGIRAILALLIMLWMRS